MQRTIDSAGFIHSCEVFGSCVVEAEFKFFERNLVRCVAVYLVGAHKDECGFGTVLPRGLKKVHGAERIDLEIKDGNIARLVVRRLCSAVNDQVETTLLEHLVNFLSIADIYVVRNEASSHSPKSFQIPLRIALRAKKYTPHVVVHADHAVPLAVKILDSFRADQAAAARHKNGFPLQFRPSFIRWFARKNKTELA